MKRSEMLKIIKSINVAKYPYNKTYLTSEGAEKLLTALEEAGMAPPFVDGVKDPNNRIDLIVEQAIYSGHCRWESEK